MEEMTTTEVESVNGGIAPLVVLLGAFDLGILVYDAYKISKMSW